jgi:hypothetical protein
VPAVALLVGLIDLLFADVWLAMTVFNAMLRSDGTGGLFWVAVVILAGLLVLSVWLTGKATRRLRHRGIANPS